MLAGEQLSAQPAKLTPPPEPPLFPDDSVQVQVAAGHEHLTL
jgi:hypothetical protein